MTECCSAQCNSYETHNIYPNLNAVPLSHQQQLRLNKIKEIKDYFVSETKEREIMTKDLVSISLLLTIVTSH